MRELRVGVVGVNGIGQAHLWALHAVEQATLAAVSGCCTTIVSVSSVPPWKTLNFRGTVEPPFTPFHTNVPSGLVSTGR